MREILTLQLGHLGNFTATHFWNLQESYFTYSDQGECLVDHDIHWRPGIGVDGSETFLPRTVIYDLKSEFGSLRKINPLYDGTSESAAAADSLWSAPSIVHKQQAVAPSAYQQSLDAGKEPSPLTTSTVRYWSDFSRVYFHPKSSMQLCDLERQSTTLPFESVATGSELFSFLDKHQDVVDTDWRPFVEECDLMQGTQVFTTMDDAWGGFAASYLEALRDEYPKSCIWVWGLQSPSLGIPGKTRQLRLSNTVQTLHQIYGQSSMLVPLALPPIITDSQEDLDSSSSWHVTALLAAMAEVALTPCRLRGESRQPSLSDLAEMLNIRGNQHLAAAKIMPSIRTQDVAGKNTHTSLFQLGWDGGKTKSRASHVFGEVISQRGPLSSEKDSDAKYKVSPRHVYGESVIKRYKTPLSFPLLNSYPPVFGTVTGKTEVPLRATMTTDTYIYDRMKVLRLQATSLIHTNEREALDNGISEIADAYRDDWSSGSDEDDDDL
ncbi:uncharacterized protein UV8b_03723 [Ustilaginoidea virens]|uniref:Uncharacterized protein n=1 Tax=Ustilaginoidea virens TaxID=1159556 RepID=A0A8E5HQ80_USTVR|nr:uncharacterized protein UV8b_03723 [Ustilaginoidea virens]QUC19482.1 hypothetical protein UV8b_03723 [Ustilaginoidea virens]